MPQIPAELPKEITDKRRLPKTKEHKGKISKSLIGRLSSNTSGDKHWHWNGGRPNCIDCGKKVILHKAKRCRDCYRKFSVGTNNSHWRGGITPQNSKTRNRLDYTMWRKAILERDNFTCQKYKIRGGDLVVHHINNFAEFPELRFSIDNGITLSKKAHNEFHKIYGKRNNTREQLEEFLCQ